MRNIGKKLCSIMKLCTVFTAGTIAGSLLVGLLVAPVLVYWLSEQSC